jgi:hypothetical protein
MALGFLFWCKGASTTLMDSDNPDQQGSASSTSGASSGKFNVRRTLR